MSRIVPCAACAADSIAITQEIRKAERARERIDAFKRSAEICASNGHASMVAARESTTLRHARNRGGAA